MSQFDAELSLAARGYTKCLDVAEAIINDRPLLADDGESLRAIATNLWMSSKHKVSTIAPELVGSVVPFPEKGSGSIPMGATQQPQQPQEASKPNRASVKSLNDTVLVEKVLAGHAADDDGKLDDNGKAFLVLVDEEVEDRELWEDAYDELCSNNFLNIKKRWMWFLIKQRNQLDRNLLKSSGSLCALLVHGARKLLKKSVATNSSHGARKRYTLRAGKRANLTGFGSL